MRIAVGLSQIKVNGENSLKDNLGFIQYCYDKGVRLFDCSPDYFGSEELISRLPSSKKYSIDVATKNAFDKDKKRNFSIPHIENCINQSLKKLKIDRISLFQLNKPTIADLTNDQFLNLLTSVKKSGKVKNFGLIVGELEAGFFSLDLKIFSHYQVLHNLLYRESRSLIESIYKSESSIIVRSPLNSGILTGIYDKYKKFPKSDPRAEYFSGTSFLQKINIANKIIKMVGIERSELLSYSLRYILSNRKIGQVLIGINSVEQFEICRKISLEKDFTVSELKNLNLVLDSIMKNHLTIKSQNL